MRLSIAVVFTLAALAGCSESGSGESFPIVLDRTCKPGDAFRVVSEGVVSSTVEGGGVASKSERYEWELECLLEVVEIDEAGMARRLSCTVERLIDRAQRGKELAPAGSRYSLVVNKGFLQFAPGEPLPGDEVQMALTTLLTVGESGLDLEALFGGLPRRIGEKWAADVDRFLNARKAERVELAGSAGAVEGRAVLIGKTEVGGVECIKLEMTVKMTADMGASEWTFSDVVTTIEIEMKVPVDPALPILETAYVSETAMVSPAPPGQAGGDIEMKTRESVETKVEIVEEPSPD